jgi:hypothetical protein
MEAPIKINKRRFWEAISAGALTIVLFGASGSVLMPDQTHAASSEIILSPMDYGAKGNGTEDDWLAFQKAIDVASSQTEGATVLVPKPAHGDYWLLSQPLRMRSNVIVRIADPTTRLKCLGQRASKPGESIGGEIASAPWAMNGCVLFGAYTSSNVERAPAIPIRPPEVGTEILSFVDTGRAREFRAGDVIMIASGSEFRIGKGPDAFWVPQNLELNVVAASDSTKDSIRLTKPIHNQYAAAYVRRLTNTGKTMLAGGDTGIPLWATAHASLIGGSWEAADPTKQPFSAGGGALDCRVEPFRVKAFTGPGYGNLYSGCTISAHEEEITGVVIEFAFGSYDNVVRVMESHVRALSVAPAQGWLVGIDEGANHNTISIDKLIFGNAFDIVRIDRGFSNTVNIGSVSGGNVAGFAIRMNSSAYAGDPPKTRDNTVNFKVLEVRNVRTYAAEDKDIAAENTVLVGR